MKKVGPGGDDAQSEQRVWYFAYGANMAPLTMRRRRLQYVPCEITTSSTPSPIVDGWWHRPAESVAGVLDGYRLLFDYVGFPFIEPSFANIAPAPGHSVHGVLHHLTKR